MLSKSCPKCLCVQPLDAFGVDQRRGTPRSYCRRCVSEYNRAYKQANLARLREQESARRQANPEKHRERMRAYMQRQRAESPELHRAASQRWAASNRPARAALQALRRAKTERATPRWASRDAIREVYEFAQEFRDAGFDVHVDHIVPLNGREVCGLHISANLRVCLSAANLRKYNKLVDFAL